MFEQSISSWWLSFLDPAEESRFRRKFSRSLHLTCLMRTLTYVALAFFIVYRLYAILLLEIGSTVSTGTLTDEVSNLIMLSMSVIIDTILKVTGRLKSFHGVLLYFFCPFATIYASFYTQRAPYFGISSGMVLMMTHCVVGVYITNWKAIGVTNVVLSLSVSSLYYYYFRDGQPLSDNIFNFGIMVFAINLGTVFYYMYEKAFRKLHFMEREVKRGRKRWKAILDSLPLGVMLISAEKEIKLMNKEMKNYIAPMNGLVLQQSAMSTNAGMMQTEKSHAPEAKAKEELMAIRDRNDPTVTLKSAVERDDDREGELQYQMDCPETQKVFEVKTKYLPVIWPQGYKLVVVKDQTIYEQLVKEKMLEKYTRMLVASISHEIRTPLNAVEGYLTSLAQDLPAASMVCDKIEKCVTQIDFILTGACNLIMAGGSGGDSSPSLVPLQPLDVRAAVGQVVDVVQPSLEGKAVRLNVQIGEEVPEGICTDGKKYKLILFNLLKNAVKYTETGSICVRAWYSGSDRFLSTEVSDTGPGISPDKMARIFELYANVDTVNQVNPQGMGLGLSLCKRLSRVLGGDITASSELDKGTSFVFTLQDRGGMYEPYSRPLTIHRCLCAGEALDDTLPVPADERKEWDGSQPYVSRCTGSRDLVESAESHLSFEAGIPMALIVDDEATNRLVLRTYLASLGVRADEANNGRTAVDKVSGRSLLAGRVPQYRLVLMDINMPVMDGTTATDLIRRIEGTRRTRIVAVTAANLQAAKDVQCLLDIGFDDVIQKPVSRATFVETVRKYV